MPTTYACPTEPHPPSATLPLVQPEAALHLVAALLHPTPRPETVAIWLAADRTGLGCIAVEDAESPDDVIRLVKVLATSVPPGSRNVAIVLATHRPGWGPEVDDCDTCCFDIVDELLAEAGIALIDWFQIDDGIAVSLAEHLRRRPRWQP